MVEERPTVIAGRYRLMNRIGSGGMGHVWLAWDERLNRAVAVKQLHSPVGLPEAEARVAHDRAMREARITARLHHPNAVPVFDVVDHEGQPCLVMQYLPSRSLQAVLTERGPLPAREVARIGSELAAALAAAHRADIVHRDVKPGNVLVADDGTARITDFGISHALGDASLTSTGMVTGTPAYLAPEVARGTSSSAASDVFSLGATLYAAVEGPPPFGTGRTRWRCCTGSPPARSPHPARAADPGPARDARRRPRGPSRDAGGLGGPRRPGPRTGAARPQRRRGRHRPGPYAGHAARRGFWCCRGAGAAGAAGAAAAAGATRPHRPPVPSDPPARTPPRSPSSRRQHPRPRGRRRTTSRSRPTRRATLRCGPAIAPRSGSVAPGALLAVVAVLLVAGVGLVVWAMQGSGTDGSRARAGARHRVRPREPVVAADPHLVRAGHVDGVLPHVERHERAHVGDAALHRARRHQSRDESCRLDGRPGQRRAGARGRGLLRAVPDRHRRRVGPPHGRLPHHDRAQPRDVRSFWRSVDTVDVRQVAGSAPESVVATLRYAFTDGRRFDERTSTRSCATTAGSRSTVVGGEQPSALRRSLRHHGKRHMMSERVVRPRRLRGGPTGATTLVVQASTRRCSTAACSLRVITVMTPSSLTGGTALMVVLPGRTHRRRLWPVSTGVGVAG